MNRPLEFGPGFSNPQQRTTKTPDPAASDGRVRANRDWLVCAHGYGQVVRGPEANKRAEIQTKVPKPFWH
jgi:hypothetical protein